MSAGLLSSLIVVCQVVYFFGLLVTIWLRTLPVDRVAALSDDRIYTDECLPAIVMLYPVLRELEETMRTTLIGLARADYPAELLRVICIPNEDDRATIAAARRLALDFPFLEVLAVPPTSHASWQVVWNAWSRNPQAYWWHVGRRAGDTELPPKKTRQLVWALYHLAADNPAAVLTYIDADSVVPTDYWYRAALGLRDYDVLQFTNITGNLLTTLPASFHALDHILWDATFYPHMSAHGAHPFYTLGKGLFFRIADLIEHGGFHPWLTIEDPEVGLRLWVNGKRLGIVESPLIEEVPATWRQGVTQRKRWICGFFQTLGRPLVDMGMPWSKRIRARLNFVPCLSLAINPLGFAIGAWAVVAMASSDRPVVSSPFQAFAIMTFTVTLALMGYGMLRAWRLTAVVLASRRRRLRYVALVNPLFMLVYWLWWSVSLTRGFAMYLGDGGLVWQRTEKVDANHVLIRSARRDTHHPVG